jgi:hypothetical protein
MDIILLEISKPSYNPKGNLHAFRTLHISIVIHWIVHMYKRGRRSDQDTQGCDSGRKAMADGDRGVVGISTPVDSCVRSLNCEVSDWWVRR